MLPTDCVQFDFSYRLHLLLCETFGLFWSHARDLVYKLRVRPSTHSFQKVGGYAHDTSVWCTWYKCMMHMIQVYDAHDTSVWCTWYKCMMRISVQLCLNHVLTHHNCGLDCLADNREEQSKTNERREMAGEGGDPNKIGARMFLSGACLSHVHTHGVHCAPQVHWAVRCLNLGLPSTFQDYYDSLAQAFVQLVGKDKAASLPPLTVNSASVPWYCDSWHEMATYGIHACIQVRFATKHVCVHTRMYTHMYVYIHVCIYTCVYMYIHTCIYVYIEHLSTRIIHIYILYIYICIQTFRCHMCLCVQICVYTDMCMYVCMSCACRVHPVFVVSHAYLISHAYLTWKCWDHMCWTSDLQTTCVEQVTCSR